MQASFCAPFNANFHHPQLGSSDSRLARHTDDEAVCQPGLCDVQDVIPAIHCRESPLHLHVWLCSTDVQKRHDHVGVFGAHAGLSTYTHGKRA